MSGGLTYFAVAVIFDLAVSLLYFPLGIFIFLFSSSNEWSEGFSPLYITYICRMKGWWWWCGLFYSVSSNFPFCKSMTKPPGNTVSCDFCFALLSFILLFHLRHRSSTVTYTHSLSNLSVTPGAIDSLSSVIVTLGRLGVGCLIVWFCFS